MQERVVPEIGMLRVMWRELETGSRTSLAGHEGETPDTDKGRSFGLPRQLSTLPTAGIIGNLPSVPAMDIHYGQAAVFTPSAIADSNVETLLVTDVDIGNLYRSRSAGSVTPRLDRRTDLFELKVKLKNLDTSSELTDGPEIELPK